MESSRKRSKQATAACGHAPRTRSWQKREAAASEQWRSERAHVHAMPRACLCRACHDKDHECHESGDGGEEFVTGHSGSKRMLGTCTCPLFLVISRHREEIPFSDSAGQAPDCSKTHALGEFVSIHGRLFTQMRCSDSMQRRAACWHAQKRAAKMTRPMTKKNHVQHAACHFCTKNAAFVYISDNVHMRESRGHLRAVASCISHDLSGSRIKA
jgi:hypothetical protein